MARVSAANRLRRWPLATVAICLFAVVVGQKISQGAPIVFKFDATVSEIQGDMAALNLPFSLAIGQTITGMYTFQSAEDLFDIFIHPERGKQGMVSVRINGTDVAAGVNFGSLNQDGPPVGPNSSLFLGYVSPTDVYPGWGGSVAEHPAGVGLALVGPEGPILAPEDVLNVDTWNGLTTFRGLGISIGWPDTLSIQATVGEFVAVPEPSTIWLVWALLACNNILVRGPIAARSA
jgi:hypothetical protein